MAFQKPSYSDAMPNLNAWLRFALYTLLLKKGGRIYQSRPFWTVLQESRLGSTCLDQDNVPVFDNIILSFGHDFACTSDSRLIAKFFQDIIIVDYTLNESLLKV